MFETLYKKRPDGSLSYWRLELHVFLPCFRIITGSYQGAYTIHDWTWFAERDQAELEGFHMVKAQLGLGYFKYWSDYSVVSLDSLKG